MKTWRGKPKRRWMDIIKYDLRFDGLGIVGKYASAAADDYDHYPSSIKNST